MAKKINKNLSEFEKFVLFEKGTKDLLVENLKIILKREYTFVKIVEFPFTIHLQNLIQGVGGLHLTMKYRVR